MGHPMSRSVSVIPRLQVSHSLPQGKFPYAAHMAAAITVLASGSRGNCSVVSTSRTKILVDAGLSGRETLRRMHAAGEDPTQLSAILVSHEHSDHVSGVYQLSRKLKIPVYMTGGTHQEWRRCRARPAQRSECAGSLRALPGRARLRDRRHQRDAVHDSARCGGSGGVRVSC